MLSPLSSQGVTPTAHCCPREFTTIRRQHRPHEKIEEGSCSPPSTLDPFPQSVERSQPLLRSRAGIPTDEIGSGFNRLVQTVREPHSQGIRSHHTLPTRACRYCGRSPRYESELLSPIFADYLLTALSVLPILGSGLHRSQQPVRSLISGQRSFTACHCRHTELAPEMVPAG